MIRLSSVFGGKPQLTEGSLRNDQTVERGHYVSTLRLLCVVLSFAFCSAYGGTRIRTGKFQPSPG
jgi:hypothetical protein